MTLFQIVLLVFFIFIIVRVVLKYARKEITLRECLLWSSFWVISGALVGFMRQTDIVARQFGIERGADLFIALSIVIGYYVMFKIFVHIERLDRDITKIVRKIAIEEQSKK
ncbi:MAG: hypothetical protein A3B94_00290 [Candidatus Jacksonbacteria bacterium RIFCSPHIGHO2_02_FULL_43_10]|nr:MAG: hypothetical protein A3B94_00290 [Candidatus Jacksonbacteria bacterium RIFCSPHIGHO2_02_FULL_43_10]